LEKVTRLFEEAPDYFSEKEADVWSRTLAYRSRDWWTHERLRSLEDYCRYVVRFDQLTNEIKRHDVLHKSGEFDDLDKLLRLTLERYDCTRLHLLAHDEVFVE